MGNELSVILKTVALQYLAVLLGVAWWSAATSRAYWGNSLAYWPTAGLLSVTVLIAAAVRAREGPTGRRAGAIAALAGYATLVTLWDPFLWIEDGAGNVVYLAVVLPPLLGLKPLVRSGSWLAVGGVVLFSASSVACLLFNGTVRHWGRGFSGFWVE